ncbi:uncharacterized protein LOC144428324 [Styela clava]
MGPSLTVYENTSINFVDTNPLASQIERLWRTDFADVPSICDTKTSREDRIARSCMEDKLKFVDGHYELPLLWKIDHRELPCNQKVAENRLRQLKRRLLKDDTLRQKYIQTMNDYVDKRYARIADSPRSPNIYPTKWLLPHHPVINPKKPDKLRIVFDCASKSEGLSLNDALMSGPDLVNSLVGVLTRFRRKNIAIIADIESMFHQIRVKPEDRAYLRFLWWVDGDLSTQPVEHEMTVHLFGAPSSPSCAAFCLLQTAKDFGAEYDSKILEIVKRDFYVDDCLSSCKNDNDAVSTVMQLRSLLSKGGFKLTKWMSNSKVVLNSLPESERCKQLRSRVLDDGVSNRILGVYWNALSDEFGCKIDIPDREFTRRGILSALSSLFDPLGFWAPVTLTAKLLLQDLCRKKIGWDDPVCERDANSWANWLNQIHLLENLKICRCLEPLDFGRVSRSDVHIFADASNNGYSAVAYLRLIDEHSRVHCAFLMGKSRLAPIKPVSVPRLELTAAVLAVRLGAIIRKELDLSLRQCVFWADSTAILQSIRNSSKRFTTFVANRLTTIEQNCDISNWRYVPTKLNPADDGSRGVSVDRFLNRDRWLRGPDFLWLDERDWPIDPVSMPDPPLEFQPSEHIPVQINLTDCLNENSETVSATDRLIQRYSSWTRLRRATAWLMRYKLFLLMRVSKTANNPNVGPLTLSELRFSETQLVKYVQWQMFPKVMEMLGCGIVIWNKSNCSRALRKLSPVMDSYGVMRVGGRLDNASIPYESKHPAILPNEHHLTSLLIIKCHIEVGHSGMSHTWTTLRQTYWVLKGGAAVRKVIGKCIFCRKRNAHVGEQIMSDLPAARLYDNVRAFSYVGVDFFGPMTVKQGRSQVKVYGCLFTCLSIRAVHIELASSLSTDDFIDALRRFTGRRGRPVHIYCDNGSNFVGACRELKESISKWNEQSIANYLRQRDVEFNFNPPYASHMGGVFERMIKSTKRILSVLLTGQSITHEKLETLLVEVESILNSRPITPVIMDHSADEPLTPNHLLLVGSSPNVSPGVFTKRDCYVRQRWRQVQYLADEFWRRWIKEYLPTITQRSKWTKGRDNFKVDDIVLLVDESIPRGRWTVGRVINTFPDKHGLVRSVLVRTGTNVVRRPITKLCRFLEDQK